MNFEELRTKLGKILLKTKSKSLTSLQLIM